MPSALAPADDRHDRRDRHDRHDRHEDDEDDDRDEGGDATRQSPSLVVLRAFAGTLGGRSCIPGWASDACCFQMPAQWVASCLTVGCR